jgi:hypothetical protein
VGTAIGQKVNDRALAWLQRPTPCFNHGDDVGA